MLALGCPGIGDDGAPALPDFRTYVGTIFGAGDYSIKFANSSEDARSAGLEANHASRKVVVRHKHNGTGRGQVGTLALGLGLRLGASDFRPPSYYAAI